MGITEEVRAELEKLSDKKIKDGSRHYFKEPVDTYGVKMTQVGELGKRLFKKIEDEPKQKIFEQCETLWKSGKFEESIVACLWTEQLADRYEKNDMDVFERWLGSYVSNWASCDTLCNHSVAMLVEKYPELVDTLKIWAVADNRWMRRGAAVTLILPARKGLFLSDIFEIAGILLSDKDDLVQKGYGWMLKAASEARQQEVYNYIVSKRDIMPRTAYRYALEKMPENMRREAMRK